MYAGRGIWADMEGSFAKLIYTVYHHGQPNEGQTSESVNKPCLGLPSVPRMIRSSLFFISAFVFRFHLGPWRTTQPLMLIRSQRFQCSSLCWIRANQFQQHRSAWAKSILGDCCAEMELALLKSVIDDFARGSWYNLRVSDPAWEYGAKLFFPIYSL